MEEALLSKFREEGKNDGFLAGLAIRYKWKPSDFTLISEMDHFCKYLFPKPRTAENMENIQKTMDKIISLSDKEKTAIMKSIKRYLVNLSKSILLVFMKLKLIKSFS